MNNVRSSDSNPTLDSALNSTLSSIDGSAIDQSLKKCLTVKPLETWVNPLHKFMGRSIDRLRTFRYDFDRLRLERRWAKLRRRGLKLGTDVCIPGSTWIDPDYLFLISIGDHCGFGPDCLILAHDAQMDEYLDAGRVGQVIIHESCHIGARTVLLPGIEVGPRTIVGANSVVSKTLPSNTVCAGNPAKVICTLNDYLAKHRKNILESVTFPYADTEAEPEFQRRMFDATFRRSAYVTGGRSAELRGEGGTMRTKSPEAKFPGWWSLFTGF